MSKWASKYGAEEREGDHSLVSKALKECVCAPSALGKVPVEAPLRAVVGILDDAIALGIVRSKHFDYRFEIKQGCPFNVQPKQYSGR